MSERNYDSAPSGKILRLDPKWSHIEGLQPPFADDVKDEIKKHADLQQELVEAQFLDILADSQQRFIPSHPLGIGYRAILASREGAVVLPLARGDQYEIADIETIVRQGMEVVADTVRVSPQREMREEIKSLDHDRVLQYLVRGVGHILNSPEPVSRKRVIPVILIYDLAQMERAESIGGYELRFKNPDKRADALLALYPIDIDPAK